MVLDSFSEACGVHCKMDLFRTFSMIPLVVDYEVFTPLYSLYFWS